MSSSTSSFCRDAHVTSNLISTTSPWFPKLSWQPCSFSSLGLPSVAQVDWQRVTRASQPSISCEPINQAFLVSQSSVYFQALPKSSAQNLYSFFKQIKIVQKNPHCSMVPEHGTSKVENMLLFPYYSNTGKEEELKMWYQNLGWYILSLMPSIFDAKQNV